MTEWVTLHLPALSLALLLFLLGMGWYEWLNRYAPPDDDEDYLEQAGAAMLTDGGFEELFGVPARPYDRETDGW